MMSFQETYIGFISACVAVIFIDILSFLSAFFTFLKEDRALSPSIHSSITFGLSPSFNKASFPLNCGSAYKYQMAGPTT